MFFQFEDFQITGVLSVLPQNEYLFEDETADPSNRKNKRLKSIIGFGKRRRVKKDTTLSDMFLEGLTHLIHAEKLKKEDIGAVVVVTLSQDYLLPTISSILHGKLGLNKDVFCMDIPQACAGYVVGLLQSFMILQNMNEKKVILCTGEIFHKKFREDEPKLEEPSFGGDIANITIVERCLGTGKITASAYNDGTGRECLLIPDGGFRNPMTIEKIQKYGAGLPMSGIVMDGSNVFNFVQREVPPAVEGLLEKAQLSKDEIDWYIFHQPNKFMLQKLAEKIQVPYEKMPMKLTETLGNSDAGTIPAVMTTYLSEELTQKDTLCCLSGFGGGLTWATIIMNIKKLKFCENIISDL